MKVAFISQPWSYCPPMRDGSISVWTLEVARRLSSKCRVIVYSRKGKGFSAVEHVEGVEHRRFSIKQDRLLLKALEGLGVSHFRGTPLFATTPYYLPYILRVAIDLRKQGCDIVHVHNFSQFLPIIRKLNPGIHPVLHMHCEWLAQLDWELVDKRLRCASMVAGCSDYITHQIRQRHPHYSPRCHTIVNGVDIDRFRVAHDEKVSMESEKVILFVGRITPEKGLHLLLPAFHMVLQEYPRARLRIIGPEAVTPKSYIVELERQNSGLTGLGNFYEKSYLQHLKESMQPFVRERVTFVGHVAHDDLVSEYQAADILVNPSLSESFGMALIEAMATGLPVVATRVGGMTQIIKHGESGYLVEPGDVTELADAMIQLLADKALRKQMGQTARQQVQCLFSWQQVAEQLYGRYEQILA